MQDLAPQGGAIQKDNVLGFLEQIVDGKQEELVNSASYLADDERDGEDENENNKEVASDREGTSATVGIQMDPGQSSAAE